MNLHEQVIVLKNKLNDLQKELQLTETEVSRLESLPEYNKFDNLSLGSNVIEGKLLYEAEQDCEGSYNCGNPQYTQQFYVNDVLYVGILDVEYNRHDKQYYYIENTDFKVEKVD
jgi:hypothetical protein